MRLEAGILEMLNLVRSEGMWPAPIITFEIQEIPLDIWLMEYSTEQSRSVEGQI